jgi:hypothetical protein
MPSVSALRRWLVFVALLRLLSGIQRAARFLQRFVCFIYCPQWPVLARLGQV